MAIKPTYKELAQKIKDLESHLEQMEETFRVSEERNRLATSAAKVGVWDWNIKTGDFYLDPNIKAILGYTDDEIPNDLEIWVKYVHPKDSKAVMEAAQACLDGKIPEYIFEHRMLHKDGSIRWILVRGRAIRDESGNTVRLIGSDTDITKRKQAEEALRKSESHLAKAHDELEMRVDKRTAELGKTTEQLNALMNATTDTIFLIDLKGYVVAANAVTAERFGMRLDQFIGTCAYDLMARSLARSRKAKINRVVKTRKPHRFEDVRRGIVFDSTFYPVLDDGGRVVQIAIYGKDITERKRSERALKKTKEDLRIKAKSLEEMNTALKILLNTKDEDKREFEERILSNVKHLILPYLGKMKKQITDENLKAYLYVLETNLSNIISPFSQKLSSKYLYLTITEIEVANFVKEGRNSKDIAGILGTSHKTIQNHRVNIRKKLGLTKKPISLRTYLLSLQ